jgi:mannose-6-phosphate isomerase
VADHLACFHPKPGDAVFNPAGMVHSLGGGVVVFEVQQNSDVTFRLYDWNHVDPKNGQAATTPSGSGAGLHQFWEGAGGLVAPVVEETSPVSRERLFTAITSGCRACAENRRLPWAPRVCRACWYASRAQGQVEHGGAIYAVGKGDVFLLPAVLGACTFQPRGAVNVLEIEIPE